MWNLRNKTNELRGKEKAGHKGKPRNRLLTIESKIDGYQMEVGLGMGEIGDGN